MKQPKTPAAQAVKDGEVALSQVTRTNRQAILQCIVDLTDHNQAAARSRIIELTGLKGSIVDDHIDRLKNDNLIRTLYPGVYEPVDQTPDRAVSVTSLNHGRLKLEIGDDVVTDLTPREALALGKLLAGNLLAFGSGR